MVATTECCCFAYQEGTDAPCDLHEVWCRLAQTLDDRLTAVTNIVNRSARIVPAAMIGVRGTTPFEYATATPISFDSVTVDTDNMVNLDVSPIEITPTRAGIYNVSASVAALVDFFGVVAPGSTAYVSLRSGATVLASSYAIIRQTATPGTIFQYNFQIYLNTLIRFIPGVTSPLFLTLQTAVLTATLTTIEVGDFAVTWHSDV